MPRPPALARPARCRQLTLGWVGRSALGITGELASDFSGWLGYRDAKSYSLAGDLWEPSSFPWPVSWGFRLLTLSAGLVVVPLAARFHVLLIKLSGAAGCKRPLLLPAHGLAAPVLLVARVEGWWGRCQRGSSPGGAHAGAGNAYG